MTMSLFYSVSHLFIRFKKEWLLSQISRINPSWAKPVIVSLFPFLYLVQPWAWPRPALWACNLYGCPEPWPQKYPILGFMLCYHLEILNNRWTRNLILSFFNGPHKLHYWSWADNTILGTMTWGKLVEELLNSICVVDQRHAFTQRCVCMWCLEPLQPFALLREAKLDGEESWKNLDLGKAKIHWATEWMILGPLVIWGNKASFLFLPFEMGLSFT